MSSGLSLPDSELPGNQPLPSVSCPRHWSLALLKSASLSEPNSWWWKTSMAHVPKKKLDLGKWLGLVWLDQLFWTRSLHLTETKTGSIQPDIVGPAVEKVLLPTRQEAIDPNGPAWLSKRSSHRDYNPHLSCIPLGHQCLCCCWLHFQFWPTPRALSSFQPSNGMSFGRGRRKSSMSGSKNSLKGKFTANPPYYPYLWCALKSSKKTMA